MVGLKTGKVALAIGIFVALVNLVCGLAILLFGTEGVVAFIGIFAHSSITGFAPKTITFGSFITGLIASFIAGYVLGAVFAFIYNKNEYIHF